ncbi:MAG: tetratricopeptide repeat protein [Planctomycetes bacterium]|nr:tetratricopeptide repeat protein [Planctomycetota bacterium]
MSVFGWNKWRLGALGLMLSAACLLGANASAQEDKKDEAAERQKAMMQIYGLDAKHKGPDVARLRAAFDALQRGDGDKTLSELEDARKANKSLPPARVMLARLLFAANQQQLVTLARQSLEQAAKDEPSAPEVYILLGNVALSEGRLTDAQLEYTHASELVSPKFADPKAPDAQRLMRQIYSGMTSVAENRQEWMKAVQMASLWIENAKDDDNQMAQAKQRLGRAMFFRDIDGKDPKNETDVVKTLEEAYGLDSNLEHPLISMGLLATQMATQVRAERDTSKYERDAKDYDQMAQKYMDQAVSAAKSDSKLNEKAKSGIYAAVSQWYLGQGNEHLSQAAEFASKAFQADPKSPALKRLTALLKLLQHDYDGAAKELEALYQENPSDFFASNNLALALIESKDDTRWSRATQLAEVNARQYQKNPEALATVGWIYFKVGRVQEAAQLLQAAVQNNQASLDTAYYLAKVLQRLDNLNDAKRILRQAVESNGPFMHRKEAEDMFVMLGGELPKRTSSSSDEKKATPATPAASSTTPPAAK